MTPPDQGNKPQSVNHNVGTRGKWADIVVDKKGTIGLVIRETPEGDGLAHVTLTADTARDLSRLLFRAADIEESRKAKR